MAPIVRPPRKLASEPWRASEFGYDIGVGGVKTA
jgi:hypothetical protein